MNKDIVIFTYSCDRNSVMWEIMMTFMKKYWSDCPYRHVLLTDVDSEKKGRKAGFDEVIEYDSTWADMHRNAIEKLGISHFIMWMDDLFLYEPVDTQVVERLVSKAIKRNALCLYLSKILISRDKGEEDFNIVNAGDAYCYTSACGLWDSEKFLQVINLNWSPWDFERIGSMNAKNLPGELLVSKKYLMKWDEGIFRGKWLPRGVELCEREGIDISNTGKAFYTKREMRLMKLKEAVFLTAPRLITKISNLMGR